MALKKEDAIGYESSTSSYVFICKCGNRLKSTIRYLPKHSGKCRSCAHKERPHQAAFTVLNIQTGRRGIPVTLSYEEFCELCALPSCEYCGNSIQRGKKAYYLDRKDNSLGYTKDNCVPCCADCNKIKGGVLSYEEMKAAMSAVRLFRDKGYYRDDDNNVVFGARYLLQRGFCCGSGCQHCPYGPDIQRAASGGKCVDKTG